MTNKTELRETTYSLDKLLEIFPEYSSQDIFSFAEKGEFGAYIKLHNFSPKTMVKNQINSKKSLIEVLKKVSNKYNFLNKRLGYERLATDAEVRVFLQCVSGSLQKLLNNGRLDFDSPDITFGITQDDAGHFFTNTYSMLHKSLSGTVVKRGVVQRDVCFFIDEIEAFKGRLTDSIEASSVEVNSVNNFRPLWSESSLRAAKIFNTDYMKNFLVSSKKLSTINFSDFNKNLSRSLEAWQLFAKIPTRFTKDFINLRRLELFDFRLLRSGIRYSDFNTVENDGIDYDFWVGKKKRVRLFQAAYLLHGHTPPYIFNGKIEVDEIGKTFLLLNDAYLDKTFHEDAVPGSAFIPPEYALIEMDKVVRWAKQNGYKLSSRLNSLSPKNIFPQKFFLEDNKMGENPPISKLGGEHTKNYHKQSQDLALKKARDIWSNNKKIDKGSVAKAIGEDFKKDGRKNKYTGEEYAATTISDWITSAVPIERKKGGRPPTDF